MQQIMGYPEAFLYTLLFVGILHISVKYPHKKSITIVSVICVALICFMGIMGFIMAGNAPL